MSLCLHNPASEAHLEDLRDRLLSHFAHGAQRLPAGSRELDLIEALVNVVRFMDEGSLTAGQAIEVFTRHGFPAFSRWLVDMVDEGVYLDDRFDRAA